jgi:hypothetical protein
MPIVTGTYLLFVFSVAINIHLFYLPILSNLPFFTVSGANGRLQLTALPSRLSALQQSGIFLLPSFLSLLCSHAGY